MGSAVVSRGGAAEPELPSVSEIKDILTVLTTGKALASDMHIAAHAGALVVLPCVQAAMAHFKFTDDNWPAAVRETIKCLIASEGRGQGLIGKFLNCLFGIGENYGSLSQRVDDFVSLEKGWKYSSKVSRETVRSDLLHVFASDLRVTTRYPCSEPDIAVVLLAEFIYLRNKLDVQKDEAIAAAHLEHARGLETLNVEFGDVLSNWGVEPREYASLTDWLRAASEEAVEAAYKQYWKAWARNYPYAHPVRAWENLAPDLLDDSATGKVTALEATLVAGILLRPKGDFSMTPRMIEQAARIVAPAQTKATPVKNQAERVIGIPGFSKVLGNDPIDKSTPSQRVEMMISKSGKVAIRNTDESHPDKETPK